MSNRKAKSLERKKQLEINQKIKKRLYKEIILAPCYYCKKVFMIKNLTIEHITPLSFGGSNEDNNITVACAPCNQERGRQSWFLKRDKIRYGK